MGFEHSWGSSDINGPGMDFTRYECAGGQHDVWAQPIYCPVTGGGDYRHWPDHFC